MAYTRLHVEDAQDTGRMSYAFGAFPSHYASLPSAVAKLRLTRTYTGRMSYVFYAFPSHYALKGVCGSPSPTEKSFLG